MDPFIGNDDVFDRLISAARQRRPSHGYALLGPAHLGKTTLARQFAATLLCAEPNPPCGQCPDCQLLAAGNHPDYQELPRDDKLTINQVRELRHELSLKPMRAKWRVGLIPDAARLGVPAQNALLKTLEEPPPRTVLILTAPSAQALLPTTLSRLQVLTLVPVSTQLLGTALVGDVQTVSSAIRAAGGRPGLAKRLLADPEALQQREQWATWLAELGGMNNTDRLQLAKDLQDDPLPVIEYWQELLHQAVLAEHTDNAGISEAAQTVATRYSTTQLRRGLGQLVALPGQISYNPNVLLQLEQTLLTFTD